MTPGSFVDIAPVQCHEPYVVSICGTSSAAVNATWRAALIARDTGATLRVLHPVGDTRTLSLSQASLTELVDDIRARTGVETVIEGVKGDVLKRAVEVSEHASIVVLPSSRGHPLRQWIMGSPAERLIRLCRSPVLVVKRPALRAYGRVLVPVDLDDHAVFLMNLASSLSSGSRIRILHVLGVADERVMGAISDPQDALRQHRAQGAYVALHRLISASDAGRPRLDADVEFGDAGVMVLERAAESEAELMVIGKTQRGLLADYFLGGTTQRILAHARADVLVHAFARRRGASVVLEEASADAEWPTPLSRRKAGSLAATSRSEAGKSEAKA
jgi:nucleotide-binding universal stress UspA family protein